VKIPTRPLDHPPGDEPMTPPPHLRQFARADLAIVEPWFRDPAIVSTPEGQLIGVARRHDLEQPSTDGGAVSEPPRVARAREQSDFDRDDAGATMIEVRKRLLRAARALRVRRPSPAPVRICLGTPNDKVACPEACPELGNFDLPGTALTEGNSS